MVTVNAAPDSDKVARLLAKDELYNFNLVHGLVDLNFGTPDAPIFTRTVNGTVEGNFFAQGTQTFAGGDIMLGGGGSDRLQGAGGADIIDGDAFLHVDLTRDANGNIFAGSQIIREIRYADRTAADANAVDTAIYNDNAGNYTLTVQVSDGNGGFGPTITLALDAATIAGLADGSIRLGTDGQGFATLSHLTGGAVLVPAATPLRVDDGTDLLRNIERLEFADLTVDISGGRNHAPGGSLTIDDPNPRDPTGVPAVGDTLTAVSTLTDADFAGGAITNPITYQWQYQDLVRGEWLNVTGAKSIGAPGRFRPERLLPGRRDPPQSNVPRSAWLPGNGVLRSARGRRAFDCRPCQEHGAHGPAARGRLRGQYHRLSGRGRQHLHPCPEQVRR